MNRLYFKQLSLSERASPSPSPPPGWRECRGGGTTGYAHVCRLVLLVVLLGELCLAKRRWLLLEFLGEELEAITDDRPRASIESKRPENGGEWYRWRGRSRRNLDVSHPLKRWGSWQRK